MCDELEFADAVIEDTCHCTVCAASFVLGDPDPYVVVDPPEFDELRQQVKLCPECAAKVSREFIERCETEHPAIDLLVRCYKAGHRDGWQDGETNDEVFDAVNNYMTDLFGGNWGPRFVGERS